MRSYCCSVYRALASSSATDARMSLSSSRASTLPAFTVRPSSAAEIHDASGDLRRNAYGDARLNRARRIYRCDGKAARGVDHRQRPPPKHAPKLPPEAKANGQRQRRANRQPVSANNGLFLRN